ncbi:MAG: hypothetical protein F6K03_00155 [Kamptonema sp. SIO4C4]|nr:hypothetical protein [Kamptonema sp. SIO4C4]
MGQSLLNNSDYWLDPQIFAIWNILVGERMKGGKSAFTRNWVWNRLADGSKNHSPRALLQLFDTAKQREITEHPKNAYPKTLIRPSALTKSLEKVSKEVLSALIQEEFIELQPLVNELQKLGYSPFKADDITELDKELKLALEVGLLERYDESPYNVQRYKVPDIYRLGIGMTRKGQA